MPSRISVIRTNVPPQTNNRSLNRFGATVLFMGCLPSTFCWGQLVYVMTTKCRDIHLTNWNIASWSAVLATTLIYALSKRVLSNEYSKSLSNRNITKAKIAWSLLASGCAFSTIAFIALPSLLLSKHPSAADRSNALSFGMGVSLAFLFPESLIAHELYQEIVR